MPTRRRSVPVLPTPRLAWLGGLLLAWVLMTAGPVSAQNRPTEPAAEPASTTELASPSAETLRAQIETQLGTLPPAGTNPDINTPQIEQRRTSLNTALSRLEEAARQEELRGRFATDSDSARQTLARLQAELGALRSAMNARTPMDADADVVGETAMFETEQDLLTKESELRTLQSELETLRAQLTELGTRLTAAPRELNTARAELGEITAALVALGAVDLDAAGQARRTVLQSREYYRRRQIAALEAEVASLPVRQEILSTRRDLADLRAQGLAEDVLALQAVTGQRKVIEARSEARRIEAQAESLGGLHPLVDRMARGNVQLAEDITAMAANEPVTSRRLAALRGQTVNVQSDLDSAKKLVSLEQLDRQAGATLRRLGSQLTPAAELRAVQREVQRDLARVTRQRVVAQEQLRDLPLGAVDPDAIIARARAADPTLAELDATARAALIDLTEERRTLLRQIAVNATARINALTELANAQQGLINETNALRNLLDEKLIWVPSVPAIGLAWPRQVVLGAAEFFSLGHFRLAGAEMLAGAQRLWPLVLVLGGAIALLVRMRPAIWADVLERGKLVGRVKQDSVWHTPAVIGGGLLMATPWALGFLLLSLLFGASDNPDPLIGGLEEGFLYLTFFTLVVMSWRFWDRKGSLFGTHFRLPETLREAIGSNLRWFVPVMGTLTFGLAVLEDMRAGDIHEGFGLAVFIAASLTLAVFSYRVLWQRRQQVISLFGDDTDSLARFRTPISLLIVGLPLAIAVMAAAGWYDSADDVLNRLFTTGSILLFTYVVYGAVRRAITVAQRKIKYRQAVERREATIRARREQEAAEERGEELPVPPPVDTDKIDVSAMSRQSAQLLRTLVLVGLALMLWVIWADLFPALSIFDSFRFGSITVTDAEGNPDVRYISLWTVLKAVVMATIAIIAARNLPGFLEIFVLDRLGVDAGARYAIVTILGYVIIGTGIVLAFQQLGLQWSQLRWIVTGLSVGIGFGLQKIIANFVSGLILLFERPIRIGDYVTIGEQAGTVTRIKIRATTLMDLDNREILIPNENLISQEVTNWTLSNSTTRLVSSVGIAYGSDTDRAREVMLDVLKANPKVLDQPPPNVLFVNFGDSSLDFELRAFLRAFEDRWPVKHAIHTEINKALAREGFEIPFPQRDLNFRGQDAPLDVRGPAASKPKPKPQPKTQPKPAAKKS